MVEAFDLDLDLDLDLDNHFNLMDSCLKEWRRGTVDLDLDLDLDLDGRNGGGSRKERLRPYGIDSISIKRYDD